MAKQTDYADKVEQEALLDQHTRGKVFEDGPYQYRLFINSSTFGYGVILTLMNEPDVIDGGLLFSAVERIKSILLTKYDIADINPIHLYFTKIWIDNFGHEENLILSLTNPPVTGIDFKIEDAGTDINAHIKAYDLKAFNDARTKKLHKLNKNIEVFLKKVNPIEMDATNLMMYGGLHPDDKVIFRCTADIQTNVVRKKKQGDNSPYGELTFSFDVSVKVILDSESPLITGLMDHYSVDRAQNILTSPEFKTDYVDPINSYMKNFFEHHVTTPIDVLNITYPHNPKKFAFGYHIS